MASRQRDVEGHKEEAEALKRALLAAQSENRQMLVDMQVRVPVGGRAHGTLHRLAGMAEVRRRFAGVAAWIILP